MSIVVPVFNRPVLVVRSLDSLLKQTWRPLRVIVVDNGSTDNTLEVVRQWKRQNESSDFHIEVLTDHRKGAAYARQTGLEHTVTDKVMFFDSDDSMRPDSVESIMKKWESVPEADLIAFPLLRHEKDKDRMSHSPRGNLLEQHLVHAVFQTQCFAVKTDFLKSAGGWRGEFPTWNDFETGTRLLLENPEVAVIDRPLSDVYPQKVSITGTSFSEKHGCWEKSLDGIEKSIRSKRRPDETRLLGIVSYRRAILAADYAKEGRMDLARPLYERALAEVQPKKRPLIRFAFFWTRHRMRGAFLIVGRFL